MDGRDELRQRIRTSHEHLMSSIEATGGLIPQPPVPLPW